jgi:uncharacterized protein
MKTLFKEIITQFHTQKKPEIWKRDIQIPLNSKKIVSVIGSRRAGKTYLLYDLAYSVNDITKVVYINFEDERYTIQTQDLQYIIEAYQELYPYNTEIYFFFDEIQVIPEWEKFVRRVYDTISKHVFITGSSATLLNKEIATSLRGRTITYELYPLSFSEFLRFRGVTINQNSSSGKSMIKHNFDIYLKEGGFPEIQGLGLKEVKEKTIQNYADVMLLRDVIERNKLQNAQLVSAFFEKCIVSFAKDFSIQSAYNDLHSKGIKLTKESLYTLLHYFEEAYIVFPLKKMHKNITKQTVQKIYLIDHSFSSMRKYAFSQNSGRKLENIIYIELKRREKEIFTYQDTHECDFIVKEGLHVTQVIQICQELTQENSQREIQGLIKASNTYNVTNALLITLDYEDEKNVDGLHIKIVPAWKFLLNIA